MRLVMVGFTALAMSLGACLVEGPGSGEAKFTPEKRTGELGKIDVESSYGTTWDGFLSYVLAEADKEGYPDQRFVFKILWGSSIGRNGWMVDIRAVNENLTPLHGQNDCVDKFTQDSSSNTDSLTISKGRKKLELQFDKTAFGSDPQPFTITALEYTVIDSDNKKVTYKYKNQNATPENVPTIRKITNEHFRKLMRGDDCDHVSQSGEEGSVAP